MCSNQLAVLQCLYVQQYLASHPINFYCLQHRVRVWNSLREELDETGNNMLHTVFCRVPTATVISYNYTLTKWVEYNGESIQASPSACTQSISPILYTKRRMKTVEAHGTKIPSFLGSLHMHNARKFHVARPKFGLVIWDYELYPCELYFTLDCGSCCCGQVHAWSWLPVTMIMNLAHKMPDHLESTCTRGEIIH